MPGAANGWMSLVLWRKSEESRNWERSVFTESNFFIFSVKTNTVETNQLKKKIHLWSMHVVIAKLFLKNELPNDKQKENGVYRKDEILNCRIWQLFKPTRQN